MKESLYSRIELTHANLNQKLYLIAGTISGYHYSDKFKSTVVYTTGGIFPAKESPEDINKIFDNLTKGES